MEGSLSNQKGITLLEVMIALVLSSIALLGLAAAELRSLQYATNSFNYTVSTIQANNAIERTWASLCNIQQGSLAYDAAFSTANFDPQISLYTLTAIPNPNAGEAFNNDLAITVTWSDTRVGNGNNDINDNSLNSVTVNATFPGIC